MKRQDRARKALGVPEPICQFSIQPEPKSQVFAVKIFRTLPQMRRYLQHIRPDQEHDDAWAFTDERTCTLVLSLNTCTEATVPHEILHALFWWAYCERMRPDYCIAWGHASHERIAEAMGSMVSQFWKKFTKAGLKRTECWGYQGDKC